MGSIDLEWANFMSTQNGIGGNALYTIPKPSGPIKMNQLKKTDKQVEQYEKIDTVKNVKIPILKKTKKMCENVENKKDDTLERKKMDEDEDDEDDASNNSDSEYDSENEDELTDVVNPEIDEDAETPEPENEVVPECGELYISTKTKVIYLNKTVDIDNIFWKIPITDYWKPNDGVIKKQMKIVCVSPEELEVYSAKRDSLENYYTENIIKQVNNTSARRIKYKDERKITVGLSKKDIMNCRSKKKGAFYNCFALIIRVLFEGIYREIHVKVFNTGKMEIPGVLNMKLLAKIKEMVINIIQPFVNDKLSFVETNIDKNVLINSNFKCGFAINRKKLYTILLQKYRILSSFDPSIYPGLKCKFYFNNEIGFDKEKQNGRITDEDKNLTITEINDKTKYKEVTFVAFQTGSCLIVGGCSEEILLFVFDFFKNILYNEYPNIFVDCKYQVVKNKKKKLRKKTVQITNDYFKTVLKNYTPMPKYCIQI